ncbi:uncharacterized protein RAG0_04795 [Rhynchosporium agropyri]|uniref:Zn(2)-C6 fungal-type domain-containing protein n=1 Tax=Rhynchosporium agropyri TaxID=914238 RepID=A0A1E1KAA4_9HELO|nr:uncharacterized protein RAG0_04795 [Rhynchosporium agropyri]
MSPGSNSVSRTQEEISSPLISMNQGKHTSGAIPEPGLSQVVMRACISCARAKAKCVPGSVSAGSCERCSRLRRPCEPAAPRVPSKPRKRKAVEFDRISKSHVEKLEERLDGIVTLLKASKDPATQATEIESRSAPSTPNVTQSCWNSSEQTSLSNPVGNTSESAEGWDERLLRGGTIRQRFALIGSYNPSIDPPTKASQPKFNITGVNFGAEDSNDLLHIFKHEMNPNFPFISIPDSVSADELRVDQPSLFTAVMAVTSRDSSHQMVLGKVLMQQFADRIVVNGERNMDVLLAILTYAGWCYHHFFNRPQLTSLISLATTLVNDLRLMRTPSKKSRGVFDAAVRESENAKDQCSGESLRPTDPLPGLIENCRAALGFWYLTSIVGSFFQRGDTARWTPYMEECCAKLYELGYHRDDKNAVALIKMQLVFEKIYQNPWHGASDGQSHTAPPILYLKALDSEVKSLEANLSVELGNSHFLRLHCLNIRSSLYKIGLVKSEHLSAFTNRDFNRLEHLFACAEAVRAFTDVYLGVSASDYHTMPIKAYMDLTSNLGILQMLSTFDHQDWNVDWLRETISMPEVLGLLSARLLEVKSALNLDPGTLDRLDIFSQSSKKMTWIKMFVERSLGIPPSSTEASESRVNVPFTEGYDSMEGDFMGMMDDAWMQDILGPWNY